MPFGPRSHPSMFIGRLCSRNAFSVKSLAQTPKKTRERTCSTTVIFLGPTTTNSIYHFHFVTKHYPCDRHTTKTKDGATSNWPTRCSGPRLFEHHQHPTNLLPTCPLILPTYMLAIYLTPASMKLFSMNPHQLSGKEFQNLAKFLNMWLVVSSSELLCVCVCEAGKFYVCIFQ
jgi:hypothetical protein